MYSPTRAHSEVFVRGEDRRLHFFYVQGGQWQHDGLGPAGTQALQGDIAAVYSSRAGRNHSEAFHVGQNGLLNYSYVENGGWKQDASHFAAAGAIHGRIAAVYSEARSHPEVFVRGADGLLHFFYLDNGAWAHDGSHGEYPGKHRGPTFDLPNRREQPATSTWPFCRNPTVFSCEGRRWPPASRRLAAFRPTRERCRYGKSNRRKYHRR